MIIISVNKRKNALNELGKKRGNPGRGERIRNAIGQYLQVNLRPLAPHASALNREPNAS